MSAPMLGETVDEDTSDDHDGRGSVSESVLNQVLSNHQVRGRRRSIEKGPTGRGSRHARLGSGRSSKLRSNERTFNYKEPSQN